MLLRLKNKFVGDRGFTQIFFKQLFRKRMKMQKRKG